MKVREIWFLINKKMAEEMFKHNSKVDQMNKNHL